MKMNSLVDADMIDELYEASQDGVKVDLIVRGICCLRPGVPGLSDNIAVRSIVGRYLEHSRIYRFANGRGPGQELHFIGSADLMPRNLDRRVEALVPVRAADLRIRMDEILAVSLADDTLAWAQADDHWERVPDTTPSRRTWSCRNRRSSGPRSSSDEQPAPRRLSCGPPAGWCGATATTAWRS